MSQPFKVPKTCEGYNGYLPSFILMDYLEKTRGTAFGEMIVQVNIVAGKITRYTINGESFLVVYKDEEMIGVFSGATD